MNQTPQAPYTPAEADALIAFHRQYSTLPAPEVTLREQFEDAQMNADFCREEYGTDSAEYKQAALMLDALTRLVERTAVTR